MGAPHRAASAPGEQRCWDAVPIPNTTAGYRVNPCHLGSFPLFSKKKRAIILPNVMISPHVKQRLAPGIRQGTQRCQSGGNAPLAHYLSSKQDICQRFQLRAGMPWPGNATALHLPEIPSCSMWMEMLIPGRVQLQFKSADGQE